MLELTAEQKSLSQAETGIIDQKKIAIKPIWELAVSNILRGVLSPLSRVSLIVGGSALVTMVLLTVADILLRTTFHFTVPGSLELVKLLMILVVFSGMCAAELEGSHITVTLISDVSPPKIKQFIKTNALFPTLVIILMISIECIKYAFSLSGRNSGLLRIPLWPFPIVISFGMALFFLAVSSNFFQALHELRNGKNRNYLLVAPGVILTLAILVTSLYPGLLPEELDPPTFGIIGIIFLFILVFSQIHIGATMGLISIWGLAYLSSPTAGLASLSMVAEEVSSNYFWVVIPLFVWVGMIVFTSGFSKDLYHTTYRWLGHMPGGLASATIAACAAFAAVVGDTVTGAVTMGKIALPEMKKYNYDDQLATGCIAGGGSLGTLIPPSMSFVVYGLVVEQSIGKLLIAGIIPGILAALMFIGFIYVRCRINPALGPAGPYFTWKEKLISLKNSASVFFLFLLIVGGIYSGIVSPTEAASLGAFAALIIVLTARRLTMTQIFSTIKQTLTMSAMLFFILICASSMTQFFTLSNIPNALSQFIVDAALNRYLTLAIVLSMYLILGCLLPALPVLILTLPVVYPVVLAQGFDPIMFGVLVTILAEIGVLTPPFGITVFALSGITDVPMYTIFKGSTGFWFMLIAVVILIVIFPQIALFLPGFMKG